MHIPEDWKPWAISNHLLENGQVWEGRESGSVFQIDKYCDSYRVVFFTLSDGDRLDFTGAAFYEDVEKVLKLLGKMGAKPTSRLVRLRRM